MNATRLSWLIVFMLALAVEVSRRHDGPPVQGATFSQVVSYVEKTRYRSSTRTRILMGCFLLALLVSIVLMSQTLDTL